jgi:hypothetical protein
MEASASEPVLRNEDYSIPSNGVGDTGHPKRVLHGPMAKDKGTYSSRINQIVKQAEKVPGPGKYVAHEGWDEGKTAHVIHAGNKFPNGPRDYKPKNTTPAPATYESKGFQLGTSIASNPNLSCNPRVLYGQCPKGKKRSFLDQAINHGHKTPAPGHNDKTQHSNYKMDTAVLKNIEWSRGAIKTKSPKPVEKEIGPDHYSVNFAPREERQPCYAVPKAKAQNFLDKAVKEKYVDLKSKKEMPGPGTYNVHNYDDSKFSRGTKYLQLRGMTRSSVSGYF